ncbi:MAG: hypothetical protein LBD17_03900 [Endomicrobium sp.]|jgi:hypothetical protein|nr:hypothetical protein [Endomicrobium sp.]
MKKLLVTFVFLLLTIFANAQVRNLSCERHKNQETGANVSDIEKHRLGWLFCLPGPLPQPIELIQLKKERPFIRKVVKLGKGVFDEFPTPKADKGTQVNILSEEDIEHDKSQASVEIMALRRVCVVYDYVMHEFDGDLFTAGMRDPRLP